MVSPRVRDREPAAPFLWPAIAMATGTFLALRGAGAMSAVGAVLGSPGEGRTALVTDALTTMTGLAAGAALLLLAARLLAARLGAARWFALPALLVLVLVLAAALAHIAEVDAGSRPLARLADQGRAIVSVRGVMLDAILDPPPRPPDRFGRRSVRFRMAVESLATPHGPVRCAGVLEVRVTGGVPYDRARPGSRLLCRGRLFAPQPARNPGQFDGRWACRARGISGILALPAAELMTVEPGQARGLHWYVRGWLGDARQRLWSFLQRASSPRTAGLLGGLLLGIREAIATEDAAAFRRTGSAHFFAISGLHVMFVAAMLDLLLSQRVRSVRCRAMVIIAVLVVYAGLTGGSLSVTRATIMIGALYLAAVFDRRSSSLNALAIAALVMLLARPHDLLSASFQLSFAAVFGLIVAGSRLPDPGGGDPQADPAQRMPVAWRALVGYVRESLWVSVVAWWATVSIVLTCFHALTPALPLANVLLFPLVAAVLVTGMPVLVLALVLPDVAVLVLPVLGWLAELLLVVTASIDTAVLAPRYVTAPTPPAVLAHALGWLLLAHRRGRPALAFFVLATVLFLGPHWLPSPDRPGARAQVLEVGHGLATVVELPDGRILVFDAGSISMGDVGARVVAPALWSRGVRRIDALMLSHSDQDHTSGVAALFERFAVGSLLYPPRFATTAPGRRILALAARHGISGRCVSAGSVVAGSSYARSDKSSSDDSRSDDAGSESAGSESVGSKHAGYRVLVLHPPRGGMPGAAETDNETSLAVVLDCGPSRLVLTGDLEEWGIARMARRFAGLAGDPAIAPRPWTTLVLPHHGAPASNIDLLLDAVRPDALVVSARRGFADERWLAWDPSSGLAAHLTWRDGPALIDLERGMPPRQAGFCASP